MQQLEVIFGEFDNEQRQMIREECLKAGITLIDHSVATKKSVLREVSLDSARIVVVSQYGSVNKRFEPQDCINLVKDWNVRVIYLLKKRKEYSSDVMTNLFQNGIYDILYSEDITPASVSGLLMESRSKDHALDYMGLDSLKEKLSKPLTDEAVSSLLHYINMGTADTIEHRLTIKMSHMSPDTQEYFCNFVKENEPIIHEKYMKYPVYSQYIKDTEPEKKGLFKLFSRKKRKVGYVVEDGLVGDSLPVMATDENVELSSDESTDNLTESFTNPDTVGVAAIEEDIPEKVATEQFNTPDNEEAEEASLDMGDSESNGEPQGETQPETRSTTLEDYYAYKNRKANEERKKAEEETKRKAEEEARRKAEEEVKRKAEEEARRKAAEEARRKAEEEARRKAEEEAKRKAEEEARRKAAEEARRKAEEEARRKAEEEAKRKAEEEAKRKAEEEARRKAAEEARRKAAEEARRKAADEARRKAEEEARRKAEEEARRKAEEEARRKAEEAKHKAELEAERNRLREEAKRLEEEKKNKAEEEARHRAEIEKEKNRLQEEAKQFEEDRKRKVEEDRKKIEEERRKSREENEKTAREERKKIEKERLQLEKERRKAEDVKRKSEIERKKAAQVRAKMEKKAEREILDQNEEYEKKPFYFRFAYFGCILLIVFCIVGLVTLLSNRRVVSQNSGKYVTTTEEVTTEKAIAAEKTTEKQTEKTTERLTTEKATEVTTTAATATEHQTETPTTAAPTTEAPVPPATTEAPPTTEATTEAPVPISGLENYDKKILTGGEVMGVISAYGGGYGIFVETRSNGVLSFGTFGSSDMGLIDAGSSYYGTVIREGGSVIGIRFIQS